MAQKVTRATTKTATSNDARSSLAAPPPPGKIQSGASKKGTKPAPGKIQDNPRFRGLPRHVQKRVESGELTLDQAAGLPAAKAGPDAPGGGGAGGGGGLQAGAPPPPSTNSSNITDAPAGAGENKSGQIGDNGFHAGINPSQDMDSLIKQNLQDRLNGQGGPYTPEMMSMLKGKLFDEVQGQIKRGEQNLYSDAARRGIFRSGVTSKAVRDVQNEGIRAYSSGVRDLIIKKMMADYEDKQKAMDLGMKWLDSKRNYELGLERNAIARDQIKASLAAAAMQAAATRYAADQSLKGTRAMAGASRAATAQRSREAGVWDEANQNYKMDQQGNYVPASAMSAGESAFWGF